MKITKERKGSAMVVMPEGFSWHKELSSSKHSRLTGAGEAFVPARSVLLLTGKK